MLSIDLETYTFSSFFSSAYSNCGFISSCAM